MICIEQSFMKLLWAEFPQEVRLAQISCCDGNLKCGQNLGPQGGTGIQVAEHGV